MKEEIFKKGHTRRIFSLMFALVMSLGIIFFNSEQVCAANETIAVCDGEWYYSLSKLQSFRTGDQFRIQSVNVAELSYTIKNFYEDGGDLLGTLGYDDITLFLDIPDGKKITTVETTSNTIVVTLAPLHEHSWKYEASGNMIEAYCENEDCPSGTDITHKVSLELSATSPNYSGSPVSKSTIFGGMDFTEFNAATKLDLSTENIEIYAATDTSKATPLDEINAAGSYVAVLTVDGNDATLDFKVGRTYNITYDSLGYEQGIAEAKNAVSGDTITITKSGWSMKTYVSVYDATYSGTFTPIYDQEITSTYSYTIPDNWLVQDISGGGPGNYAFVTIQLAPVHTHTYNFGVTTTTTTNDTLTWYCGAGCPSGAVDDAHAVKLTLVASDVTYSGSEYTEATLEGAADWTDAGFELPTIIYVGTDETVYEESDIAPSDIGTYTAMITFEGETVSVNFEIKAIEEETEEVTTEEVTTEEVTTEEVTTEEVTTEEVTTEEVTTEEVTTEEETEEVTTEATVTTPATKDSTPLMLYAMVMVVASAGIVVLKKKYDVR